MKCEVNFCIYNQAWECRLKSIQINALGMCGDCIFISLDDYFLNETKRTQLDAMEAE